VISTAIDRLAELIAEHLGIPKCDELSMPSERLEERIDAAGRGPTIPDSVKPVTALPDG
jgi:hypothetical protein